MVRPLKEFPKGDLNYGVHCIVYVVLNIAAKFQEVAKFKLAHKTRFYSTSLNANKCSQVLVTLHLLTLSNTNITIWPALIFDCEYHSNGKFVNNFDNVFWKNH